jgi:hypothetical protein
VNGAASYPAKPADSSHFACDEKALESVPVAPTAVAIERRKQEAKARE